MKNVKLILSDLDGCFSSYVGVPFNLPKMVELRDLIARKGLILTFCTGRPKPYIEAVMQIFDIKLPAICENGAVIFDPVKWRSEAIESNLEKPVLEIKMILEQEIASKFPVFVEPGKVYSASLIPENLKDKNVIKEVAKAVDEIKKNFPIGVYYNVASNVINILPNLISKRRASEILLDRLNIDPKDVLAVGDSFGDLDFMNLCGRSACPANSDEDLKKSVSYLSSKNDIEGMIDIIENV